MKYVPPIFAFLALLVLMALPQQAVQGAADKTPPQKPEAPAAVTSTPTPVIVPTVSTEPTVSAEPTDVPEGTATPLPQPIPERACLRINFEVTGDVAEAGTYEVVETNGHSLVSWEAKSGWQDSGWFYDLEVSFEAVYVNVVFHPADGSDPVTMVIVNPAPGTSYGWVARGMCHALEVGWPESSKQ